MKYRSFGNTGKSVSEVGMGCWQFGGEFGPMPEDTALETMQTAVDQGIAFFDTADVYGGGRSEKLIGEFLKGGGDRPYVATKFGRGGGVYPDNYSKDALRRSVEASL
jgi:aryl-alcohol dehydrogenase-like predicted oxidoreductase